MSWVGLIDVNLVDNLVIDVALIATLGESVGVGDGEQGVDVDIVFHRGGRIYRPGLRLSDQKCKSRMLHGMPGDYSHSYA